MRKIATLSLFFCMLNLSTVFSQLNFDSLSHISFVEAHDTYLNDIWGHIDSLNNEYVLVGARKGVSIVDLSVPENPKEVYWIDGETSIWRNVNTWQKYAYATTEAKSGLLILDMNSLPDASGITSRYYKGPAGNEWESAHTIYVDSVGYAYIFGANRGNGGVIILDVKTDPLNPIEVGVFDNWYCHDGYVIGDTLYLAHISDGFMSIVDISDRSNPILLGTKTTHNNFTHNIWTSPDGQLAFTTDEVSGAFIGSYDVSDPSNIIELDLVQSSPGVGVIPHNVHYLNGFLIVANYSDGVVVYDAHRPNNLVYVGRYDTYPGQTTGYDGCWATYPFHKSGIIAASDISEGLFILKPDFHKASYLEGLVTDQSNGNPLSNVKISFANANYDELSKSNGTYATGILGNGNFSVTFFKVGYYPQTFQVNMQEGIVTNLDVALIPIPKFPFKIIVKDVETNQVILNANVLLKGSLTQDETVTNGLGEANFQLYYEESYSFSVGLWTYKTTCFEQVVDATSQTVTIYLKKGIYDDFTFDYAWTSSFVDATKGFWVKGKPNPTNGNIAPGFDSNEDCGDEAYVTGNDPNLSPDFDDVQQGEVILYSPIFDLQNSTEKYMHYSLWFFNLYGPLEQHDDTLKIFVSNGDSTVLVDYLAYDENLFYKWNKRSVYLPNHIGLNQTMQLIVRLSDYDPNINITEGGLDNFFMDTMDNYNSVPTIPKDNKFVVFPNPFNDQLHINFAEVNSKVVFYDMQGNIVHESILIEKKNTINLSFLARGIYFIKINNQQFKVIKT